MVEGAAADWMSKRAAEAMRAPIQTQNRAKVLRRSLSQPEQLVWAMLRRNQLGLHFRRQHAVGRYILDFYCAAAKLCVEVDGPAHEGKAEYDQRRTGWLMGEGIRVLRFTIDDIERRPAVVLATIKSAAGDARAD